MVALDAADYWGHNTTEGTEDKKEEEEVVSFAQQKGIDSTSEQGRTVKQEVLNHHFNTSG